MLTDQKIRQWAGEAAFRRGCEYFRTRRVKRIMHRGDGPFYADVRGTHLYHVEVSLDAAGELAAESCDCPAFDSGCGICKHIVAVLKTIQQDWREYFPAAQPQPPPRRRETSGQQEISPAARLLLSAFADGGAVPAERRAIRLLPVLYYRLDHYPRPHYDSWLEFSVGEERLYVMKDIPAFLAALQSGATLEYGKNFSLRPQEAIFEGLSGKVLALLQRVYAEEAERSTWYYSSDSPVFRDKRRMRLTQTLLREFLQLYEGSALTVAAGNEPAAAMPVTAGRPPLHLRVNMAGEAVQLELDLQQDSLIELVAPMEYVCHRGTIYKTDEGFRRLLAPVLACFDANRSDRLLLPPELLPEFATRVLPRLETADGVEIGEAVRSRLHREPLEKCVYLDRDGEAIRARVELHYGELVLNPLQPGPAEPPAGKWLLRDERAERELWQWFSDRGFTDGAGQWLLADEPAVYEFLRTGLAELDKLAVVYYADDFRSLRVRSSIRVRAGVRLSADTDWLELSLDCEEASPGELFELVAAYRLKKKYHRLADGGFLSLDSPEFETVATLLEQLDLTAADLEKPAIALPKAQALYLDSLTKSDETLYLDRSPEFRRMVRELREPQETDVALPAGIRGVLRGYQEIGYRWLKSLARYGLGGILADDMGLGKTLQVLAFLLSEREKPGPSLVVAPTSLVFNWQEEAARFTPDLRVLVIAGQAPDRQALLAEAAQTDLLVTSYGMLKRDVALYASLRLKYCFLDEAQNVKNPQTLNAKTVRKIEAGVCFALTGTPIENSLTELWSVFDFILPGYLRNHADFVRRFETPIVKNADAAAQRELSRHIRPFVLRRMKRTVLRELPEKIESKVTTPMTPEQIRLYTAWLLKTRREFEQEVDARGFDQSRIKILALLTRLRQICCHPSLFIEDYRGGSGKLSALADLIQTARDGGHRALIFSQFTGMLELIQPTLAEAGVRWHYLDGATPASERIHRVNAFNGGDRDVFLISLKAGGTGLNLTGADMVVHCDPWWNPAVEDQATDRAYRIGQQNVVQVFKLVAQGTIEEKIHALQAKKRELIDTLIQPGETFLNKLTEPEIRELFR